MSPLAPAAAPPEAFIVGGGSGFGSFVQAVSAFASRPGGSESGFPAEFMPPNRPGYLASLAAAVSSGASRLISSSNTDPAAAPPPPQPVASVDFDFDGDGKADISRRQATTAEFKVVNSSNGSVTSQILGSAGAKSAPGDFDGDNKTDMAVFDAGTWTIKNSSNGATQTVSFGASGDIPECGDYDGDGKTDLSVIRPSTNTWWVRESLSGSIIPYGILSANDIGAPGDYDGDGKTDLAFFRPSTGVWYIYQTTNGLLVKGWGNADDVAAPADFDGDGKTDIVVFRRSTGVWYVMTSLSGFTTWTTQMWGNWGDQPVPADYDGDGKADYAVWRPTTGVWWIMKSNGGSVYTAELGSRGDLALPSAYVKQVGGTVTPDGLAGSRLSPKNATGDTDLYSRNFAWGTSLVNLPGRAGLNAGLGISYNSLIWTKAGGEMYFDLDNSNAGPGFRLGFPVIEPVYYDGGKQTFAYMMVAPSGSRIEFRQTAVSSTYETADSSYLQLKVKTSHDPNDIETYMLTVTSTDGTQMTYAWLEGAYRCTQIKDRNGNFITIGYDANGLLQTVTDTLNRDITVHYDSDRFPTSITQEWQTGTHTYATFTYGTQTLTTNFSGLTNTGPPNDTVLKVLSKITYTDLSSTEFDYNSYGQVWKIRNNAADGHELNYSRTDLSAPAGGQSDCPRFTETAAKVQNFNLDNNNVPQESVVHNTAPATIFYSLPGKSNFQAANVQTYMDGDPGHHRMNLFFGESGWSEGLPLATEDCLTTTADCTNQKRWTWTEWTQDDTSLPYIQNPRSVESRVGDGTNVKRTTTDYRIVSGTANTAEYGLVSSVKVYDADLSTVIKQVSADYKLTSAYVSRRIIGLPSKVEAWGKDDLNNVFEFASKVTYDYDTENFSLEPNQIISGITQHDPTYDSAFVSGRGNLTIATRCDVALSDTNTCNNGVTAKVRYDIAGSTVARIDPMDRKVRIGYADNPAPPSGSPSTYAYPTVLTDPAGTELGDAAHSSNVQYRYDIGANVWAKSANLNPTTPGKETTRDYDDKGRLSKETIVYNGAYTRYEYPTNGIQSKVYSTLVDVDGNNIVNGSDETLSETWADGAGRVRFTRSEHPGSAGGWSVTRTEYDKLGRATRETVPTEVTVPNINDPDTWHPAGDDDRGTDTSGKYIWLWNSQEYDWKGRVTRVIPSDSDGTDGKDQVISYDGCGCAGGQVTTIQGENIVETDWQGNNPATLGRRTQKVYEDILGRVKKTEVYNWNGSSIYATTVNKYNGRDQVVTTYQYDGAETSSNWRAVSMGFDGHGRMAWRKYPIEDTAASTSWTYNADDSISTITDPRQVVTHFSYYTNTGLLQQMTYDVPSGLASSVPDTPDVSYSYDNAGNRTSMTDGTGSTSYAYDSLSRMTSETKNFSGLSNSFTIGYAYQLSGAVRSVSDPQNPTRKVIFDQDRAGRLVGANGDVSGTSTQYLHGVKYRAWGDLGQYVFDVHFSGATNTSTFDVDFDNRQQVSSYSSGTSTETVTATFTRYADGKLRTATTGNNVGGGGERYYSYDFAGRLTKGYTGTDANPNSAVYPNPYKQDITYDAFSEVTGIAGKLWGTNLPARSTSYAAFTGRIANAGYDAAGNVTSERIQTSPTVIDRTLTYDAAGRQVGTFDPAVHTCCEIDRTDAMSFDGDGQLVKTVSTAGSNPSSTVYQVRSTVLGGEAVGKLTTTATTPSTEVKEFTVPALGGKLAFDASSANSDAGFTRTGPEGLMEHSATGVTGVYDPRGANVGTEEPDQSGFVDGTAGRGASDPSLYTRCAEGGIAVPCSKQERFDRRGDEIIRQIWAQWAEEAAMRARPADPHGATPAHASERKASHEIQLSPEAYQTTSTDKPEGDPETPGPVPPASDPCKDGVEDDGAIQICTNEPRIGGGVDASVGGPSERLDPPVSDDHCRLMAQMLQVAVDAALKELGGREQMTNHSKLDSLVSAIDSGFTPFYLGVPGLTARNLTRENTSGGVPGPKPPFAGATGFKAEYQDSYNPGEEQTHHFAAYFSAGINGESLKAFAHKWATDTFNLGDQRLGDAAFALGASMNSQQVKTGTRINRNNPRFPIPETTYGTEPVVGRFNRILGIADRVRYSICN